MENPFLGHDYPTESLLDAVNGLLKQIDEDFFGPVCRIGQEESVFLKSVREAAERENYFKKLKDEALAARPEVQI
jgi:hypothetical protein